MPTDLRDPEGSSPVARQILALQVLVVVLVVVGACALAWTDARRSQVEDARTRALAVAETVADNPLVSRLLADPGVGADPVVDAGVAERLQPYAEVVRADTRTDFVVVMDTDRTRYTHPDETLIGQEFIGDLGDAPAGGTFTQEYTGTLGPSMRAVVPVVDAGGGVVGLVSVGITTDRIQDDLLARVPSILLAGAAVLGVGLAGAWLISRRVRRQTHGLGEGEITRMYEYYDAVLHAVREGLLLLDPDGRVRLFNEEARRLLDLPDDAVGRPVSDLVPPGLATAAVDAEPGADEIHLADASVLVVNSAPARWDGREVGRVVTLRDHTELRAVTGELDTVRGLAESLRSQNHEAANRLHTVVSLVELGRTTDAVAFATEELAQAQLLADRVVASVEDPVLSALLLGKTAQAAERGLTLVVTDETQVEALPLDSRAAVTVVGNLVDNALDAAAGSERRLVEVGIDADAHHLHLLVGDSGPGIEEDVVERVFERGWSSKEPRDGTGRGLGLALVVSTVRRAGGEVRVGRSALGGASFEVRIGDRR